MRIRHIDFFPNARSLWSRFRAKLVGPKRRKDKQFRNYY